MPDSTFDQEFVRLLLKFSDEDHLAAGFHMNAAGWIAWVQHVAEMSGKRVSNLEALKRLERILDDKRANPLRPGVREQWENRVIERLQERREGTSLRQKIDEALGHLKQLFDANAVILTSEEWHAIHAQFRIRLLEIIAVQMALGGGEYHVRDAAARAFRTMWADNEWGMREKLPDPLRAWMPVYKLEEP